MVIVCENVGVRVYPYVPVSILGILSVGLGRKIHCRFMGLGIPWDAYVYMLEAIFRAGALGGTWVGPSYHNR
jgi:hypothetical protein